MEKSRLNWHFDKPNSLPYTYLDEVPGDLLEEYKGNFTECKKCERYYLELQSALDLMPMIKNSQPECCPKCRVKKNEPINPMQQPCCDKCFTTHTEHDYPAHLTREACINLKCDCHQQPEGLWEEELNDYLFIKHNVHPKIVTAVKGLIKTLLTSQAQKHRQEKEKAVAAENKEWREGRRCAICGEALVMAEEKHTFKCPNECIKNLRVSIG